MDKLEIGWSGPPVGFDVAKRLADSAAGILLADPICLSWYDRGRDLESPGHVNECHRGCDTPGYIDYAHHRGGMLVVDVGAGAYVFCYRPLGEFGD